MPDPGALAARGPPAGYRKLVIPGFCAFLLTLFLIGLGVWQLHRLKWKLGILAEIRASESRPGIPLTDHPGPYAKVVVSGRLRPDLAVLFADQVHGTPAGLTQGGQLIVPLERAKGMPVLVDLGWVPVSDRHPAGLPSGLTTVAGYVRPAEHRGFLSAPDDVAGRRFFTLDPARIAATVGLGKVAPFTLIALGARQFGVYPMPAEHLPHPPNNHLEYALTWFGLALVVVLEFTIWSRQRLRG
ncbi:MAG: SURF1 family protein [Acetobacteraceae bacterium]